jgi:hypothetical protein
VSNLLDVHVQCNGQLRAVQVCNEAELGLDCAAMQTCPIRGRTRALYPILSCLQQTQWINVMRS